MKILHIRFKNLNSLTGQWHIDLTHPAFACDGIFAITGPTGSGKTTILDAICLALYGRTPRLNKINKSGNELMSRQTGECFAEVTFETQSGRFRCHWSQRRARKKPEGELQAPKHEIANADSGQIIESNIRAVAEQIESVTGMDFNRFTRSILLAQGGFAAFLQESPDGRAPLLEQITGTEIYSQISMCVHERQRQEKEKLNLLQAETTGILTLAPEQENEMNQTLESKQIQEKELAVTSAETSTAIAWIAGIDELNSEISELTRQAGKLQLEMEAFQTDREQLSSALRAASLDGAYATLCLTRQQQHDDIAALITEQEVVLTLESNVKQLHQAWKLAEQQSSRTKQQLKEAATVLQKVRALDQSMADQKKAVIEAQKACIHDAARIDKEKQAIVEQQNKRAETHEMLKLVDNYFREHAQDEWLVGALTAVEQQLDELLLKQQQMVQKQANQQAIATALSVAEKSAKHCRNQSAVRKQQLQQIVTEIQQRKEALKQLLDGRLLRECRTQKDTLLRELSFRTQIAQLQEHRARLQDGKPCPVCGAIEHPYAQGNIPQADEIEKKINTLSLLISNAEDQEAAVLKLEKQERTARDRLREAETLQYAAEYEKKAIDKALAEGNNDLAKFYADFAASAKAVSVKLQPLGIPDMTETDISGVIENLRTRLATWQSYVKEKENINKQLAYIDSMLKQSQAVIATQMQILDEKKQQLETLEKRLTLTSTERYQLYGNQNPNETEQRLNHAISDAEAEEKRAAEHYYEQQQKCLSAKARRDSFHTRIERRNQELTKLENDFSSALTPAGFLHEKQFLKARLPSEIRAQWIAKAQMLDERQTALNARRNDRQARLAIQIARKMTDKSRQQLEMQQQLQQQQLTTLREMVAGLKHRLDDNRLAKERIKEKQTAIEAQTKECRRWNNLHYLIGSADGKKYRNYAQGLTFERMIVEANRQLQKMTDRYLLVRDDEQPLELNVVDNYQSGEIRSTKNLSGGESFIVSLSLALGLSHMASNHVRVDCLFLDEGFGTLDNEALDTALETLASLRQEGKLIGVISHVDALKERINAQIQLTPQTGGTSRISGPGCSRIDSV